MKEIDPGLDRRIQARARWISRNHPELADDVAQEMWYAILKRAEKDPTFLDQTPAYVIQYGEWAARTWLDRVALKGAEDSSPDDVAPCGALLADIMPSRALPVERWVVSKVTIEMALALMDETARGLALALLAGFTKSETARQMGRSPAMMTYAGKRIAQALATAGGG